MESRFCSPATTTLHLEQNLAVRRIAVVALTAIQFPILRNHLAKIVAALDAALPGSFQLVDCGEFSRKQGM
jgi:hypothetical protein